MLFNVMIYDIHIFIFIYFLLAGVIFIKMHQVGEEILRGEVGKLRANSLTSHVLHTAYTVKEGY